MGVPKITSLYCLYNDNSGIFWETQTHMIDAYLLDQRGKGLMGKQPNFPIGILRKFLIFFTLLPSTFSYKNFEGLSRLLTDINFHMAV